MKSSILKNALVSLILPLSASISTAEPIVAADVGGNYLDASSNSVLRDLVVTGDGDFDGDGAADDTRTYLPIATGGTQFMTFDPGLPGKNNRIFGGGQVVFFNQSSIYPGFGLMRYNGSGDYFQVTSDWGVAEMGMAYAWFIEKQDFLVGSDAPNLKFANTTEGFTAHTGFSGTPLEGGIRRARGLVKAGDQWYVTRRTSGSKNQTWSTNPYEEKWHLYDPATNMFVYELPDETYPTTDWVKGSTLEDIQAVGVLLENTLFEGFNQHAVWLQLYGFTVELDENPAPSDPGYLDDPILGQIYEYAAGWAILYMTDAPGDLGALWVKDRNPDGTGWIWHENLGYLYLMAGDALDGGVFAHSETLGWLYIWSDFGDSVYSFNSDTVIPWLQ